MGFKGVLAILLVFGISNAYGQEAAPVATPTPCAPALKLDPKAPIPWDQWFQADDYTIATDKTDYAYFFWDAQPSRSWFEAKEKKTRLAEAALQLVNRLYPAGAKADLVKVDIVYVLERDNYCHRKWESLQKAAHFEFSRARAQQQVKTKKPLSEGSFKKFFSQFEFY